MAGFLFYIILIIYVVYTIKKNKNRSQRDSKQTVPKQSRQTTEPNRQRNVTIPNQHECTVTPNEHECSATPNQPRHEVKPNVPAPRKSVSEKQHELKKRLQQQYAGRSGRLSQYSTPRATPASDSGCIRSDDIMGRANANVAEYADNRIEEEGKQTSIPVTAGYIDNCLKQEDDCSLLDRVNDLILMGYQADLTFERDFVAEGIDMLNRFSA